VRERSLRVGTDGQEQVQCIPVAALDITAGARPAKLSMVQHALVRSGADDVGLAILLQYFLHNVENSGMQRQRHGSDVTILFPEW
jgi:hypothetical protein